MSRVRRSRHLAFTCHDEPTLDVGSLLRGAVDLVHVPRPVALSALTGSPEVMSREELALALSVPEGWTARNDVLAGRDPDDSNRLDELARKGVVVTDEAAPELAELRRREETLTDDHWSAHSAVYHFLSKWRDVRVSLDLPEPDLGKPPPHFVPLPEPAAVTELERSARPDQLYEVLRRRRTSRGFDRERRATADEISTILAYVWGCHGIVQLDEDTAMLKKTSPSGGGLHPIEVYPLVRDVDGVEPGLYHYDVGEHALELVTATSAAEAEELAAEFTAGQTYFQGAHALFLMAGRFDRMFWKYRNQVRAYMVLLMDAGHLSQTFYLVCTELGLGAFVTGAINGANIEERLGLDGYKQGALLVCGCGPPGEAPPGYEPVFDPYPR